MKTWQRSWRTAPPRRRVRRRASGSADWSARSRPQATASSTGRARGAGAVRGAPRPGAATYELALEHEVLGAGGRQVAFRILDEAGEPLTSYDVQHEKQLHLIAVRRDLAEFRHVHPRLDPETGRWTVPISLGGGAWRLYADFAPAGSEPTVAEADLMVGWAVRARGDRRRTRRSRASTASEVQLERDEATSMVTLPRHPRRRGRHRPAALSRRLRPSGGDPGRRPRLPARPSRGGRARAGGRLPGRVRQAGRYRLFLDFKHGGRVHTADFTITADTAGAPDDDEEGGAHDH